jgi:hypothetical protein
MPRYANYNKTVEDCLIYRVKSLTENNNNYLKSYGIRTGTTSWTINGQPHAKIDFKVTHTENGTFITFDYRCNGEPIKYNVNLINRISNLGKGVMWFFVCPVSGKRCRKLYLYSKHFLHREAYKSLMYESQLKSQKTRNMFKVLDAVFIKDEVYEELYKKYFKTHYNGKETKRYKKLKNIIETSKRYPTGTLESLLMM